MRGPAALLLIWPLLPEAALLPAAPLPRPPQLAAAAAAAATREGDGLRGGGAWELLLPAPPARLLLLLAAARACADGAAGGQQCQVAMCHLHTLCTPLDTSQPRPCSHLWRLGCCCCWLLRILLRLVSMLLGDVLLEPVALLEHAVAVGAVLLLATLVNH